MEITTECKNCGKSISNYILSIQNKPDSTEWVKYGFCSHSCFSEFAESNPTPDVTKAHENVSNEDTRETKNETLSNKEVIRKMFAFDKLNGSTIDAVAIIYQEEIVKLPPPQIVAQELILGIKHDGMIDQNISLSSTALIKMRQATIHEAVKFHQSVRDSNDALAKMLAGQLHGRDLSRYSAWSLTSRGRFNMIWYAIAVK